MAPTSKPFVSLDEVRGLLPIRPGNVDHDEKITNYILVASRQIEQATKRFFERQVHVQYFSSRTTSQHVIDLQSDTRRTDLTTFDNFHEQGLALQIRQQTLLLQSFPIDTVEDFTVVYDPRSAFDSSVTAITVNSDNYVIDPDTGRLHLRFSMHQGRRRIRVTFTGGFLSAGTPATLSADLVTQGFEDIRQAAIIQTVFLFKKWNRENIGKKGDQAQDKRGNRFGPATSDFWKIGGLTPEAGSLLAPYKGQLHGHH